METSWPAFVLVVLAAYAVPGPDLAVILRAATRGRRAGFAAALGAQTGLCVHVLLAVVGLSVVLARHPDALTLVRVLGGAYLLYLGGRLVAGTLRRDRTAAPAAADPRSAFAQGLLTNLLNPKAVLFFASVLPQFVVPGDVPTGVQVAVLGALDVLLGLLPWTVVVLVGARLSRTLSRRRVRDWWDRVTGTVLGGLGAGLLARS